MQLKATPLPRQRTLVILAAAVESNVSADRDWTDLYFGDVGAGGVNEIRRKLFRLAQLPANGDRNPDHARNISQNSGDREDFGTTSRGDLRSRK